MKKIITALAMTLTLGAQAEEPRYEHCESMSNLSYNIMAAHQRGIAMSTMMNEIGNGEITRIIIKMAYEEPRYTTPEYQERAQAEFRDHVYSKCVNSFDAQ